MQHLRWPYQGFLAQPNQHFYWKLNEPNNGDTVVDYGPNGITITGSPTLGTDDSLFNPSSALDVGSKLTNSAQPAHWGVSPVGVSGHLTTSTNWSLAGWYSVTGTSAATQCFLEYAKDGTVSTTAECLAFGLYYIAGTQQLVITGEENTPGTFRRVTTTASLPLSGMLGITREQKGTGASYVFTVYLNGEAHEVLTSSNLAPTVSAGNSANCRWALGASLRHGNGDGTTPALVADASFSEWAMWREVLTPERMRSLYGDCRSPIDERSLLVSRNQHPRVRVLIEDSAGAMQDYSLMDSRDWVTTVDINETVEEPVNTATVSLKRRFGRFADLSPLNTESQFAGNIDFRRRVIIQRAMVPAAWTILGYEWVTRFEGYVDTWEINDGEITVGCVDKAAPLLDQYVLAAREYNYGAASQLAEVTAQQIIDDNVPTLPSTATTHIIGFKGGTPTVFTEAGTSFSPHFVNSAWQMNYNSVPSAPVMDGLKSVSDSIAFDLRYYYYPPSQTHRLTFFNPPRDKLIPINSVSERNGVLVVETSRPHRMAPDQSLTIASPGGTFDGTYAVDTVESYTRLVLNAGVAGTPATVSGGSLTFSTHWALTGDDVMSYGKVSKDLASIRNQIVVRIARDGSSSSLGVVPFINANGTVSVILGAAQSDVDSLDPDGVGFEFTLSKDTPSSGTIFAGSYTGTISGKKTVTSQEAPFSPSSAGFQSADFVFESEYLRFKQYTSTATASVLAYGLRPAAVYEGSVTNIDTFGEATNLADRLLDDLSDPQADLTIKTKVFPFELHDMLSLAADPKGRWNSALTCAIVGITEKYAAGECYAEYTLRGFKPSGSRRAGQSVLAPWTDGAIAGANNSIDMANHPGPALRSNMAGVFGFTQARPFGKPFLRNDRMELHISTASGFIPNSATYFDTIRGGSTVITKDGAGADLSPGTRYYLAFRYRDVDDNLSLWQHVVPPSPVRYLGAGPGAYAVKGTDSATLALAGNVTHVLALNKDNGSDEAGISFDTFGNYFTGSPATGIFQCPASGTYNISHHSKWEKRDSKPLATVRMSIVHSDGGGVLAKPTVACTLFTWPVDTTGTTTTLILQGQAYCSSGDLMFVSIFPNESDIMLMQFTTASYSHAYTSFALVSQS